MDAIYLNDWKETKLDGLKDDFGISDETLAGVEILLASYTYEDYSGSAFVLFAKYGELFEVNGSHCSCYGLGERNYCGDDRTQWQPEETSLAALQHRINEGSCWDFQGCKEELQTVLAAIAKAKGQA